MNYTYNKKTNMENLKKLKERKEPVLIGGIVVKSKESILFL